MILSLLTALLVTAATPGPLEVVKTGNADVQKAVSAKGTTAEQLSKVVERFVDFGELSRRALGATWNKITPAQRQDFSATMEGLLRASYAQRALGQGKAQVQYGEESIQGHDARVSTTVKINRGERYPVDYKLFRADDKADWRIYDVVTDGVSLLDTYQEQFQKLVNTKGFDGLLATLKTKRAQLEKRLVP
jgi:phospholipid transport system substrate-binding protein